MINMKRLIVIPFLFLGIMLNAQETNTDKAEKIKNSAFQL